MEMHYCFKDNMFLFFQTLEKSQICFYLQYMMSWRLKTERRLRASDSLTFTHHWSLKICNGNFYYIGPTTLNMNDLCVIHDMAQNHDEWRFLIFFQSHRVNLGFVGFLLHFKKLLIFGITFFFSFCNGSLRAILTVLEQLGDCLNTLGHSDF